MTLPRDPRKFTSRRPARAPVFGNGFSREGISTSAAGGSRQKEVEEMKKDGMTISITFADADVKVDGKWKFTSK